LQHKFHVLWSKTNKKGNWNIVCKASCQSSLSPFIHYFLYLNKFFLHSIFACVILCLIQVASRLHFILFCFSNPHIFYKLVYSLVNRSLRTYMPYVTLVLRCHVVYKLGWVASLIGAQPCTYKHAMWTTKCVIKRK
jgi:hypothetical protein